MPITPAGQVGWDSTRAAGSSTAPLRTGQGGLEYLLGRQRAVRTF
jgi:hypothetical protein